MRTSLYNIFSAVLIFLTTPAVSMVLDEQPPLTFYALIPFPNGESGFSFSVVSDTSVWYTTNRGVYHYNGDSATKVLDVSLFTKTQVEVFLIQALTDDDVWVLGHDAKTWEKTLYHFNGLKWERQKFPQYSTDPNDDLVLFKMHIMSNGNGHTGYAVGQDGLLYYYDGGRWSITPPFTSQTFRALYVNNEHDIWVGGRNNTIFHYNGERWLQSPVADTSQQNYFFDITFHGENNGWAVGTQGILHYDGSVWRKVDCPVKAPLQSILMISPTDGWCGSTEGDLLHYDGVQWRQAGKISPIILYGRISATRSREQYTLFSLTSSGLWTSYWGKVPTFTDVSASSNIHLDGRIPVVVDFDNNSTEDLLTPSLLSFPDRLYSNRGDGFFTEMTERLHPLASATALQVIVGDIDNNGFPDVVALRSVLADEWYRNRGGWKFEPQPTPIDLSLKSDRNIASLADMDNDGDLDMVYFYAGADIKSEPLTIYYNDGIGNFPSKIGIGTKKVNDVTIPNSFFIADLNGDGREDIFKHNLNAACEFYVNEGGGVFREHARESGLDGTFFEVEPNITWAYPIDINHDGALDVFLVWRKGKAVFFLNNGHGQFRPGEIIQFDPQGENPGGVFVDVDSDGDEDLFMLDRFYRNDGGKFSEYTTIKLSKRGAASFVDIDGDGDEDMILHAMGEGARLYVYRNDFNPLHIATVRLKGIRSNSFGIGSKVTLWKNGKGGMREIAGYREAMDQTPMHFVLDTNALYDMEVKFPSGIAVVHKDVKPGNLEITEFSPPASLAWDFVYSFNRSVNYSSIPYELLKFLIVMGIVTVMFRISFRTRTQKYFKSSFYVAGVILGYIVSVHVTVRHGVLLSTMIPLGSITLMSAGMLMIARAVVKRREAMFISHYKIMEPLGEGGMGKVFKALDTHSKQVVALKVLNPVLLQDPENRKRLMHEGQLLSSFSHPNIVKVFEVSETKERGYIAMEYLSGGTLKQLLERDHPLSVEKIKWLSRQIAEGIAEIHAHGVIHRDIKTGNIMLDGEGNVRIMDFGLSKSPLVTTMTTLGTVIGTLGYVAPEQVTGLMVDHRVDIFSFGVVLYELFTSRLPFTGENEIAVIHSIFNSLPPPPSTLRENIPSHVDALVMRCLAKHPDERFQTMKDVHAALSSVL
jgi:hypothetical protein